MENLESQGISLSVLQDAAAIFDLFIYHAVLNKNWSPYLSCPPETLVPWKSWKIKVSFGSLDIADDRARTIHAPINEMPAGE